MPDFPESNEKKVIIDWGGVETEAFVEFPRSFIQGGNLDGADAGDIGSLQGAKKGVFEKAFANALLAMTGINSQAPQKHDRDGVGHIASELAGGLYVGDGTCAQGVKGDHLHALTGDIGAGRAGLLIS